MCRWWDERKDSGAFANASVFSADTFGSIGGTSTNSNPFSSDTSDYVCVTDGVGLSHDFPLGAYSFC